MNENHHRQRLLLADMIRRLEFMWEADSQLRPQATRLNELDRAAERRSLTHKEEIERMLLTFLIPTPERMEELRAALEELSELRKTST